MRDFNLANLKPSDGLYLRENISSPEVQEALLSKMKTYLGQPSVQIACLDEIFCNAVQLRSEGVTDGIDKKDLDAIFNVRVSGCTQERVDAFIEGLGSGYTGDFQLPAEQRVFTA